MIIKNLLWVCILVVLGACSNIVNHENKSVTKKKLTEIVIGDINTQVANEQYAQHYYMGVNLAISEINSHGGVHSIPLRLAVNDSYYSFLPSYNAANNLVKNSHALVLTGSVGSQEALGIQEYSNQNKIPFIVTGASGESVFSTAEASQYTFRSIEGIDVHIKALVDNIVKDQSIKNIAVVTYSNEDGDDILYYIKNYLKKANREIKIINVIRIPKELVVDQDISNEIYYSTSKNLVIGIYGQDVQRFVNFVQASNLLIDKNVYILYGGITEWLDVIGGGGTPNGWISTGYPWYNINTPENVSFYQKYVAKYKLKPRYASYIGYTTYLMIYQALSNSNLEYDEPEINREKFIKNLIGLRIRSPLGIVTMKKNHMIDLSTYVGTLRPYNKIYKKDGRNYESLDVRLYDSYKYEEINDIN